MRQKASGPKEEKEEDKLDGGNIDNSQWDIDSSPINSREWRSTN